MNFLAHALLAGDAAADRVGGLMGDFIKGPLPAQLSPALAAGVALHRAIDSFAERHEAFVRSRARISATRRRVAGVLVDLFYDHLLACTWASYCQTPLPAYAARIYTLLADFKAALPEKARDVADRMQAQDWLSAYQHVDAVGHAIDRMAIYRIRITMADGSAGRYTGLFKDGFEAVLQTLADFPQARSVSAIFNKRNPA